MSAPVGIERDGAIATVALNNPERLNALNKAMWARLMPMPRSRTRSCARPAPSAASSTRTSTASREYLTALSSTFQIAWPTATGSTLPKRRSSSRRTNASVRSRSIFGVAAAIRRASCRSSGYAGGLPARWVRTMCSAMAAGVTAEITYVDGGYSAGKMGVQGAMSTWQPAG